MPDVHVGQGKAVLGPVLQLVLLVLDSHEDGGQVLAPGETALLADHLPLRHPRAGIGPEDVAAGIRSAQARPCHQGVDPLHLLVRRVSPEHRQRVSLLRPGQAGVALLGVVQGPPGSGSEVGQVQPVPVPVGGVHGVGQMRAGLVEPVLVHAAQELVIAQDQVPEDQVASLGPGRPRRLPSPSTSPGARHLRPPLLHEEVAGAFGKAEGRGVVPRHLLP